MKKHNTDKSLKSQRKKHRKCDAFQTGDERIELPPKVLETPIIPLDQSPIDCFRVRDTRYLYHETIFIVKRIF